MRNKGFSLIELMIVVVIIGVLAVVAMGSYNKYMASAKKAEVAAMFAEIRAKQEAYRAEFSAYLPIDLNEAVRGGWPVLGGNEPKAKTWAPPPAGWVTIGLAPGKAQLYCAYQVMSGSAGVLAPGARGCPGLTMLATPRHLLRRGVQDERD